MQWELLTSKEIEDMAKKEKICLIPIGILERHGDHGPLGTDVLAAHKIAVEAAKLEPCVVFPGYWFGQGHEATHSPGAIVFDSDLTITILRNLCDEIGRNGFTKIMFVNGHGGNMPMLNYFLFSNMDRDVPYTLYAVSFDVGLSSSELDEIYKYVIPDGGHADAWETSLAMSAAPGSVKLENCKAPEPIEALKRVKHLGRVKTPFSWYASYPEHVTGSPSKATKEAGDKLVELYAKRLAKDIKALKEDTVVESLRDEFMKRKNSIGK